MHDSKNYVSHYEYIKQVSLAWINQDLYWPKKAPQKPQNRVKQQERQRKGVLTLCQTPVKVQRLQGQ